MRRLLAVAVLAALLPGCESAEDHPARGLEGGAYVLYSSSEYGFTDELHGHLVMVAPDGSVSSLEVGGLYLGSVSLLDGVVYASGSGSEVVVERDRVASYERAHHYDLEWWAGVAQGHRWTVFNVGVRGDDYLMGVAATDRDGTIETRVAGDVVATAGCGDRVTLAIGRWRNASLRTGTTLRDYRVQDGAIVETNSERVVLPEGGRVANLACVQGAEVVLATVGDTSLVRVEGDPRWRPMREPEVRADFLVLGADEDEVYLMDPRTGVFAFAPATGRSRRVVELTEEMSNSEFSLQQDELVGWLVAEGRQPLLATFDADTGERLSEVSGEEVARFLDDHGEVVAKGPVDLRSG